MVKNVPQLYFGEELNTAHRLEAERGFQGEFEPGIKGKGGKLFTAFLTVVKLS